MTHRWIRSSRPSTRRGVTLIEIVAGLVVLSVLVSSVTLARGRFMRQWGDAQRKQAVTAAVDRMLAGWLGGEGADNIPVPARGPIDGVDGATWQTSWIASPSANRLGAGVVRVEAFAGGARVLTVDLMKHVRTKTEAQGGTR
jgi:prepilin-type N-terminal cleavage/methylation domain-containing protein